MKSLHENVCGVVKRFIGEGYLCVYNETEKLFLEVLAPAFDYGPYHFMAQNVQQVYLCLSEKLRQQLGERTVKELEANWCERIFSQYVLKHYSYFKANFEHIQMVNEQLNRQKDMHDDEYVMYGDLLYHNKHYIFTFLKTCKNAFTVPNEFKNNPEGRSFFGRFYRDDKNETLNTLLITLELLLHSYDCNIVKRSLSLFLDLSDSILLLPFESSHFVIYLGMLKIVLRSFLLFNPPILTLQQRGRDHGGEALTNAATLFKRYQEGGAGGEGDPHGEFNNDSVEVYTGEMNLFVRNDPQELTSYLHVIPSAFIKICKNYFSLQAKVYRLKESAGTSLEELLQLDSVKHFLFLLEDLGGGSSSSLDVRAIVADLFRQNACDYLRGALVQCRLRAEGGP